MVRIKGYQKKARNTNKRKTNRVLLLCAEGNNKTETLYFHHFQNKDTLVWTVPGTETDPPTMAKHLKEVYEEYELGEEDLAVCLVDTDFDERKNEQLKTADAILNKDNLRLIVSNPCFEIWYICHFTYSTRLYMNNRDVLHCLDTYIPGYKKSDGTVYDQLKGKESIAIDHAQRLENYCKSKGACPHTVAFGPSTDVYKIFTDWLYKRPNSYQGAGTEK